MEERRKEDGWAVEYIFMDTGAEHPSTYKFVKDVVDYYGIELTCLKARFGPMGTGTTYQVVSLESIGYDLTTWRDMISKYGTPYQPNGAFCTDQMKGRPARHYIADKYPDGNYVQWWGIRADEPARLRDKPKVRYLAELSNFDKRDVLEWSSQQEVDLDMPYSEITGNCVFCIKKSVNKLAVAARLEPELAEEFRDLVEDPDIRATKSRVSKSCEMYRNNTSLKKIMDVTSHIPLLDLLSSVRGMGQLESGSCSESCEAINSDEVSLPQDVVGET
jgi:hypothetical protein